MTAAQIKAGIDRLQLRIRDVESFEPIHVQERHSAAVRALGVSIRETLDRVYGSGSHRFNMFSAAATLDNGPISMSGYGPSLNQVHEYLIKGKERSLTLLRQAVKGLEEDLAETGQSEIGTTEYFADRPTQHTNEVFIVHGRDEQAKAEVARLIERSGLKAIILHEMPHQGRTIIEKFEDHGGAAGFAVVIATPDDVGGAVNGSEMKPRARQNVIGEMFWFAGRLGRSRVCALKRGDIEMPSDFAGVGYVDMDDRGAWKAELLKELQGAGYSVDWGKALGGQ